MLCAGMAAASEGRGRGVSAMLGLKCGIGGAVSLVSMRIGLRSGMGFGCTGGRGCLILMGGGKVGAISCVSS